VAGTPVWQDEPTEAQKRYRYYEATYNNAEMIYTPQGAMKVLITSTNRGRYVAVVVGRANNTPRRFYASISNATYK
jgi:hypothetical protein